MYISKIRIQNFRCYDDIEVKFNEGLNVIIGENNGGKTTLIKALQYVFSSSNSRPTIDDFNKGIKINNVPPQITIIVTIKESKDEKLEDKAVVASWLTKLEYPWEATLTYKYFLPETDIKNYEENINKIDEIEGKGESDKQILKWTVLEKYLKKYVSRIYGGNFDSKNKAESEYLDKFHCEVLDALRDVESKMYMGKNALLKQVLSYFIDSDLQIIKKEKERNKEQDKRNKEFNDNAGKIVSNMIERVEVSSIFELAKETGATIGGIPILGGRLEETDVLSILKLMIKKETGIEIPIVNNGMGYNNLIYISLLLSKFKMITSSEMGENAKVFPILLIEEPEAHLHPALQYNFLRFLKNEIDGRKISRQIFITTHSTHITSAVGLDPIICMDVSKTGKISTKYPSKVFSNSKEDQESKRYVERYLDATKSTMLFSKAILFGEGLAELIVFPILAEYEYENFEQNHVSIVRVDGLTFKHFIKIFGAGIKEENKQFALSRRVACVIDSDPSRQKKEAEEGKRRSWKKCYPFELDHEPEIYNYNKISGAVKNLVSASKDIDNVKIFYNNTGKGKTLEYDIAYENSASPLIFGEEVELVEVENIDGFELEEDEKEKIKKAVSYLKYVEAGKGEPAFILAERLKENLIKEKEQQFHLPKHISEAINWVCYKDSEEVNNSDNE